MEPVESVVGFRSETANVAVTYSLSQKASNVCPESPLSSSGPGRHLGGGTRRPRPQAAHSAASRNPAQILGKVWFPRFSGHHDNWKCGNREELDAPFP